MAKQKALSIINNIFKVFNYLSLNVLLAIAICATAFFKLPDGNGSVNFISLTHIILTAWAVYILDRILDNHNNPKPVTFRHKFYEKYQFNLSLLLIGVFIINAVLIFFEDKSIIIYGLILITGTSFYLFLVNKVKKVTFYKELLMPILFVSAVVGVPFVCHTSINLSSWVLAFIFLLVVFQNLLSFSIFESIIDTETINICKVYSVKTVQKWVFSLNAIVIVIVILLFTSENTFPSRLAMIFLTISLIMSFVVTKPQFFIKNERYRWFIDGLLLFPVFIF